MGPSPNPPTTWRLIHTIAAVIAVIAGVGVGFIINDNGNGGHSYTVTVGHAAGAPTVSKVDSADPGRAPDLTPAQASASSRAQDELAHNDQLPVVSPDAAPVQRGCVSRFVQNYSSR